MVRTQIYLTEAERMALRAVSERTGRTQSEIIREAVDRFVLSLEPEVRLGRLRKGRGMWKARADLPNWKALRAELGRREMR